MSGAAEYGRCNVCGKDATLRRKYYYYDVIPCECCSPKHFECVSYCGDCTPKPPETTTVTIKISPTSERPPAEEEEPKGEVREYDNCAHCGHYGFFRKTNDGPLLCFGCKKPATKTKREKKNGKQEQSEQSDEGKQGR